MNLDFSIERWGRTQAVYDAWWRGALDRPLVALVASARDPGRPEPSLPFCRFASMYDLETPVDDIVDRWIYELECCRFLGDAFPHFHVNFGPGSAAAFCGLDLVNGQETVWFHCEKPVEPPELTIRFDEDNVWFRRCADLLRSFSERCEGRVQLDMPDIGGNLDILSSFRPGELLLMDLYDYPDDVKRLTWEAHDAWWKIFDALNRIIQPSNHGYTTWTPLLSSGSYYMMQCDFSYMIGPDMFEEFVLPELTAMSGKLDNAFYHMDGPGQIPHLDHLLSITDLKGVQWVPGAGQPDPEGWPDIYRKIRESGKLAQVVPQGGFGQLSKVANALGSAQGLYYVGVVESADLEEATRVLESYGIGS